jgi:hypothetical protein
MYNIMASTLEFVILHYTFEDVLNRILSETAESLYRKYVLSNELVDETTLSVKKTDTYTIYGPRRSVYLDEYNDLVKLSTINKHIMSIVSGTMAKIKDRLRKIEWLITFSYSAIIDCHSQHISAAEEEIKRYIGRFDDQYYYISHGNTIVRTIRSWGGATNLEKQNMKKSPFYNFSYLSRIILEGSDIELTTTDTQELCDAIRREPDVHLLQREFYVIIRYKGQGFPYYLLCGMDENIDYAAYFNRPQLIFRFAVNYAHEDYIVKGNYIICSHNINDVIV